MGYTKAEIRPLRDDEEAVLFGLAERVFGGRAGWDDRRTLAVLESEQVFVADVGRSPAGYVGLQGTGDVVRIDQLLVSPEHEGEGIGHQLVEWAEGYAIAAGARSLQVAVESDNRRALDFYRRCGFVPVEAGLLELILPQA